MNTCIFIGRLTKDPELRKTSDGTSVLNFTLAVDRRDANRNTDFIPCKAWSKVADNMSKYLSKGSRIGVSGRFESGTYEKDGERRYKCEIVVLSFEFLDSRTDPKPEETAPAYQQEILTPPPLITETPSGSDEEKLPFDIGGY